jgi:hypothetical protein
MLWTMICKTANTKMERFEAAEASCYSHALNAVDTIILALLLYFVVLQISLSIHVIALRRFLLYKNL